MARVVPDLEATGDATLLRNLLGHLLALGVVEPSDDRTKLLFDQSWVHGDAGVDLLR